MIPEPFYDGSNKPTPQSAGIEVINSNESVVEIDAMTGQQIADSISRYAKELKDEAIAFTRANARSVLHAR